MALVLPGRLEHSQAARSSEDFTLEGLGCRYTSYLTLNRHASETIDSRTIAKSPKKECQANNAVQNVQIETRVPLWTWMLTNSKYYYSRVGYLGHAFSMCTYSKAGSAARSHPLKSCARDSRWKDLKTQWFYEFGEIGRWYIRLQNKDNYYLRRNTWNDHLMISSNNCQRSFMEAEAGGSVLTRSTVSESPAGTPTPRTLSPKGVAKQSSLNVTRGRRGRENAP